MESNPLFLGIDLGTTNIAVSVYNLGFVEKAKDEVVYFSKKKNDTWISNKSFLGASLQDAHKICDIATQLISEIPPSLSNFAGIGISNQMHGIIYVDKSSPKALSPLFTWQDKRGDQPTDQASNSPTYVEQVKALTSYTIPTGYGLMTHYYNITNHLLPDIEPSKYCLLDIGSFLAYCLSEELPKWIHPSQAQAWGLWQDTQKNSQSNFDLEALKKLNLSPQVLPPVKDTYAPLSYLDKPHFKGRIPIYSPLGDNQAGFLGATDLEPTSTDTSVLINIGTSGQISLVNTNNNPKNQSINLSGWERRPFIEGKSLIVAGSLSAGKSIDLWVNFILSLLSQFSPTHTPPKETIYQWLGELNMERDGDGLQNSSPTFTPLFHGKRTEPSTTASLTNLTAHNFTSESISLALMEGIANELTSFWKILPNKTKINKQVLILTGGGGKFPYLRAILEEKLNLPIQTTPQPLKRTIKNPLSEAYLEHACRGAARWAIRCHSKIKK